MITKEQLEEAFQLLKNDPHYYSQSPESLKDLDNEIATLKEKLNALNMFSATLHNITNK